MTQVSVTVVSVAFPTPDGQVSIEVARTEEEAYRKLAEDLYRSRAFDESDEALQKVVEEAYESREWRTVVTEIAREIGSGEVQVQQHVV